VDLVGFILRIYHDAVIWTSNCVWFCIHLQQTFA